MYQKEIIPTPIKGILADSHVAYTNANFKAQTTETLEGTVIAYNTVDEVYEPYALAGANGLNVPKYVMAERIPADNNATPDVIPVKVVWHGRLKDSQITCDGSEGSDSTTKAALPQILFDTEE